jgi:carboxyl-terminal processing protease
MFSQKKSTLITTGVFLSVAFFVFGTYVGYNNRPAIDKIVGIEHKETPSEVQADFEPFWKAWSILDEKFRDSKKVSAEDRVWGAIAGLTHSFGDPYTDFFNPKETTDFTETISGSFTGVGLEVDIKDKVLTVVAPIKDSPAYKAGLKTGDIILKIDDANTGELSLEEAVKKIRGEAGTIVHLNIYRKGDKQPRDFSITREVINVPILDTKTEGDVFILTLYSFTGTNTEGNIEKALTQFANSGKKKLLIDLRGNPGGYLEAAVAMASYFLPEGKMIVSEDYGGKSANIEHRSYGYDLLQKIQPKVAVLVDGGSASASEIVAGALSDNGVATLVGEKTFGKGSVQEVVPLTDNTLLKITVAKWLTPKGISIQEAGITPEHLVKQDLDTKKDEVLDAGISLLDK